MYMYNYEIFVCFRTYLFVRALLAKTLKLRRYRKAVPNLWSRFELDPSTVARVAGAQSFCFSGSGRRFSGVSVKRFFIFIAHTIFFFFCGEIMTQRQQCTGHATTVYNVTTLPRPAAGSPCA